MTSDPPALEVNRLLETLPREDRTRLLARCDRVQLETGQVLYEPGDVIRHVHFPSTAFVSLVSATNGHDGLQAGRVGNEGALGYELSLGAQRAPLRTLVQGAGLAWRLSAQSFEQELAESAALKRVLHRYVCVLLTEFGRSGPCHQFHQIEGRLAR